MHIQNKKGASFVEIVGVIGAVLIFLGVLWLIASNWHQIPDFAKILILVIATLGSFTIGVILRSKNHKNIGGAIILLGSLLYIASVFLIAQIFSTDTSLQGISFLFLLCWLGVVLVAYSLDSYASVFVGLLAFLAWFTFQFFAFCDRSDTFSLGVFAFGFLGIGVLFYALNLLHRSQNHHFSGVYRIWSAFYFLAITYLLSFQILLPLFWEETLQTGGYFFFILILLAVALLALLVAIVTAFSERVLESKELIAFIAFIIIFSVLLLMASFVSGEHISAFGGGGASVGLWALWVFVNMFFIGFILVIIGYGKLVNSTSIVNLGIGFFVLDIITRYIGFIGGIGNLAVFFIIGGILLLFLGWVISKWRGDIVKEIHEKEGHKTSSQMRV